MLVEGLTDGINENFGEPEKINFSNERAKTCLSLHYNHHNSYLLVNRKKIYKLKADNKSVKFPTQLGAAGSRESWEVSLKGNVYHDSVDYEAIYKPDILNIYKHLKVYNNIKNVLIYSVKFLLCYWLLVYRYVP